MKPRHLPSRRKILGSGAVAVSLPFLASLGFTRTARAACPPGAPKRFLVYYYPNGVYIPDWTPQTAGRDYALPPALTALGKVKSKMMIITGLGDGDIARGMTKGTGAHGGGTGCFLTQIPASTNDPKRTSVDQVIAQAIGSCTRLPSVQLGIDDGGGCDGGPCPIVQNISIRDATPQPKITDPAAAFDRLFAGNDMPAASADAGRRRALRASVLDHARLEAQSLGTRLSASDRRKLDQFTTSVRELEMQLQAGPAASGGSCSAVKPTGDATDVQRKVDLMTQVMVLAFQCDVTRVMTFMLGQSGSGRSYPFIGAPGGHHGYSHHGDQAGAIEFYKKIVRWEHDQFAKLCEGLDAIQEENGKTALDNSIVYMNSEFADGNRHACWDLPVIVAGSLGGHLDTGRHVPFRVVPIPHQPGNAGGPGAYRRLGELYLSFLAAFGIQQPKFGVLATTPLEGLTKAG